MGKNNDDRIIAALLTTSTTKEAAEMVGVSTKTINNRLKDPEFRRKFTEARLERWRDYSATLQGQLGKALSTFVEIMEDEAVQPQVRLNAAEAIVRNSLKVTEQVDVLAKLGELEARLQEAEE